MLLIKIYEKNLEFFRLNSDFIYDIITKQESKYSSRIEDVDEGMNCIVENENNRCFLHSIYNKNREIEEMFKDADKDATSLIICGFGFGISMEYINENFENLEEIAIIEPDLNLFKTILHQLKIYELHKYFKKQRFTFIINQTEEYAYEYLKFQFENSEVFKKQFVVNISYKSLYKGYFENIEHKMIQYIRNKRVNIATGNYSKEIWTRNCFNNIKIKPDKLLDSYFNKFKGQTAILVSAGPSLNKNIHLLKEIGKKAIIMAPGSAIKILDSHDIKPNFRFAMDGWITESKIFENINTSSSALVYSNYVNNEVLPKYNGKKINMVLSTEYLTKYIYDKAGISCELVPNGFSISNVVLAIILKMGINQVIFMGQDLCYTEGKLYADGSWSEEDVSIKKDMISTKNIYGEHVYTTSSFLGMKTIFETFIINNPHIQYINATEGGLGLEGAKNKRFCDVLEELHKKDDIHLSQENTKDSCKLNKYEDNITNVIMDIKEELIEILRLNDEKIKRLKRIKKYIKKKIGVNKLISELDYIEKYDINLEGIKFYQEVIKPTLKDTFYSIKITNGYNGLDKEKVIESKEKILWGVAIELRDYVNLLIKLVDDWKIKDTK